MVFVDALYLLVPSSSWFPAVFVTEINNPFKHLRSVKPLLVDNFRGLYYPPSITLHSGDYHKISESTTQGNPY